jgi:hypothetical protein
MNTAAVAVETTQWIVAIGSLGSALVALASSTSHRSTSIASVDFERVADGARPIYAEISHPWPPNEANILEPATWRLELLIVGDNISPERSFVRLSFDGTWLQPDSPAIWEHFLVHGPLPKLLQPPAEGSARGV